MRAYRHLSAAVSTRLGIYGTLLIQPPTTPKIITYYIIYKLENDIAGEHER